MSDIPPDLHPLEYSRHILEEVLGWPAAKANLELLADCLRAIGKAKRLSAAQSCKYLARAIGLAKEQGVSVDRFFLLEGRYMEIRPEEPRRPDFPEYTPIDWKTVEREQSTPEWLAANAELRAKFARLAGKVAMP